MDATSCYPDNASDSASWKGLLASTDNRVREARWREAEIVFTECRESLERHFAMEERSLFIVYEKAIGISEGPTSIMRMEHRQIRAVLAMLNEALDRFDAEGFIKHTGTLDTMLRQHCMKKESVRYLMADETFSVEQEALANSKN
jgi:DUF438 domain-containing protein